MNEKEMTMLTLEKTLLIIVDVQGKLAQLMYKKEPLFGQLQKIVKGAKVLGLPILWLEQNPKGLGPTIPEVADLMEGIQPISKFCFSCCGNEDFMQALKASKRSQVLIAGIEAHICVYQTAADLVKKGYGVQVVSDAVSSRTEQNLKIGLDKAKEAGAALTSVETALFELIRVAEGPAFKKLIQIVK
jgi:hypothetical protein